MPRVSVIIPTHNRPQLLKRALRSALNQTYDGDIEVIVVDVGLEKRSDRVVQEIDDPRVVYIKSPDEKNGSEARNIGIKKAHGEYIAFLDDDDEWFPEKLSVQMGRFADTPPDVGFSFTAVINVRDDGEEKTNIPDGINDYHELALEYFSAFLTVTLIVKRSVFEKVELFDERFPSHQESDLMIRITKEYKGLGINKPLTRVNMGSGYERTGSSWKRRVAGRKLILEKYREAYQKRPFVLAQHYFWLGVTHRDAGQDEAARHWFRKAWQTDFKLRYVAHWLSMMFGGVPYRMLRKSKE